MPAPPDWTPNRTPIHILLATYQGGEHLRAQLDSIRAQQDSDWRLLIRDDGSSDGTRRLIDAAAAMDSRIRVLDEPGGRLGAAGNFFALMEAARAEDARMFALSDQDDFWYPDKLAVLRAEYRRVAAMRGREQPILIFSDLAWVDANGRCLARSGFDASRARPALSGIDKDARWLLAMNLIPGCAMLGNRALLDFALPRPRAVEHHDWWLALLAAAVGTLVVVDRPLGDYRLHAGNTIGAASWGARIAGFFRRPSEQLRRGRRTHWQAVANARALADRMAGRDLDPDWRQALAFTLTELGSTNPMRRARASVTGPVRRVGWARGLLALLAAAMPMPDRGRDGHDRRGEG